jgi:hypothetical protein
MNPLQRPGPAARREAKLVDLSSLPAYPLPSRTKPEDARGDIDWGLFLSRVLAHGTVLLLIGLMAFTLALVFTGGQIMRLVGPYR